MKNQSLIIVEKGFFMKIKNFFYNIKEKIFFGNKANSNNDIVNEQIVDKIEEKENKFKEYVKIDLKLSDNYQSKKEFLAEMNGNIEKLELLSIDRLIKLEKYYDDIIAKNNVVINKLNKG